MAGPLRRVSQNYHWTLKRAHNDLHDSIAPVLQTALAPSPNAESVELPWDPSRLQLKLKSDYNELREHLGHSLLILLGWLLTIKHLTRAAAEHFIAQPDQAISSLYEQSAKLSIHVTFTISLWGTLAALFRFASAVPRVVFPARLFFSHSINRSGAIKIEETGTNPTSARQSPPPVQSPSMESTAHAPPEGSPPITVTSDPAHTALDGCLVDALRDGIEKLHNVMHMGEGGHFHGSPSLDDDTEKPHEYANEIAGLIVPH